MKNLQSFDEFINEQFLMEGKLNINKTIKGTFIDWFDHSSKRWLGYELQFKTSDGKDLTLSLSSRTNGVAINGKLGCSYLDDNKLQNAAFELEVVSGKDSIVYKNAIDLDAKYSLIIGGKKITIKNLMSGGVILTVPKESINESLLSEKTVTKDLLLKKFKDDDGNPLKDGGVYFWKGPNWDPKDEYLVKVEDLEEESVKFIQLKNGKESNSYFDYNIDDYKEDCRSWKSKPIFKEMF